MDGEGVCKKGVTWRDARGEGVGSVVLVCISQLLWPLWLSPQWHNGTRTHP